MEGNPEQEIVDQDEQLDKQDKNQKWKTPVGIKYNGEGNLVDPTPGDSPIVVKAKTIDYTKL